MKRIKTFDILYILLNYGYIERRISGKKRVKYFLCYPHFVFQPRFYSVSNKQFENLLRYGLIKETFVEFHKKWYSSFYYLDIDCHLLDKLRDFVRECCDTKI